MQGGVPKDILTQLFGQDYISGLQNQPKDVQAWQEQAAQYGGISKEALALYGERGLTPPPAAPIPEYTPPDVDSLVKDVLGEMMRQQGENTIDLQPAQAKQFGIDIPEGYGIKGYQENGQVQFSVVNPEGYEFRADNTVVTPEGKTTTLEELNKNDVGMPSLLFFLSLQSR